MTLKKRVIVTFEAEDKGLDAEYDKVRAGQEEVKKSTKEWTAELVTAEGKVKKLGNTGAAAMGKIETPAAGARAQVKGLVSSGKAAISSLKNVGLLGLGFSAVASGVTELAVALDGLATDSLDAQRAQQGLQVSISGAREAFGGYVSDIDIARNANMAFELGVVSTGDELEGLARGVQAKALALGKDSTQLFENAVTAIGRGSALILDNLGIILTQAEAQEIYAESLGKTVKELTAFEKSQAFGKAALMEITKAGEEATDTIDGVAAAWARGKIDIDNIRTGILGFDDSMGVLNETVRGFPIEVIEELAAGGTGLDAIRQNQDKVNISTTEWIKLLNSAAGLESSIGSTREERFKRSEILRRAATQASKRQQAQEAAAAKAEAEAESAFVLDLLAKEAATLDHQVALAEVRNAKQSEIIPLQIQALGLRQQAAEAAGDEAGALALSRDIELITARANARGGGGRGATAAEKTRAANEGLTQEMADQLRIAELQAEFAGEVFDFDQKRAELARQELETELAVLAVTKTRGQLARVQQENRAAELGRSAEIIDLEARIKARAVETRLIREAVDLETARADAVGNQTARVIELEVFRLQAQAKVDGASEARIALIQAQGEAERVVFDQREAALLANPPETELERIEQVDALAQLTHERELQRLEQEAAADNELDAEQDRLHKADMKRQKESWAQRKAIASAGASVAKSSMALGKLIVGAAVKDADKRALIEMKLQGIMSIAKGAVEVVNAAASFASLNIPQGVAHTAASVVAFATGASLLAGRLPGQGSAGATAAPAPQRTERDTSAAPTTVESDPAADRQPGQRLGDPRGAGGGAVVNIERIDVLGALDGDTGEKIAIGLKKVGFGLENTG